jgi:hypothetical protein
MRSWQAAAMHVERAEGGIKPLSVKALLIVYGVTDGQPAPGDVRDIPHFRFPARELPGIVCGETMTSAFYRQAAGGSHLCAALDRICAQAAPAARTVKMRSDTRKEIRRCSVSITEYPPPIPATAAGSRHAEPPGAGRRWRQAGPADGPPS